MAPGPTDTAPRIRDPRYPAILVELHYIYGAKSWETLGCFARSALIPIRFRAEHLETEAIERIGIGVSRVTGSGQTIRRGGGRFFNAQEALIRLDAVSHLDGIGRRGLA